MVFQTRAAVLLAVGFVFVFVLCVCVVLKYCFLIYSSIGVSLCNNALRFFGIYLRGIYELWIMTVVSRIQQCYQLPVLQNNNKKANRIFLVYIKVYYFLKFYF